MHINNIFQSSSTRRRIASLFMLLPLLAACSGLPFSGDSGQRAAGVRESEAVTPAPYTDPALDYYRWLHSAGREQLNHERIYLQGRLEQASTDPVVSIQLAMLHHATSNAGLDTLLTLLERANTQADNGHSRVVADYLSLAGLWLDALRQQHSVQQVLREQVHNNAELAAERSRLHQQVADLEQQIEALKAIEQQLNLREQLQVVP